MTRIAQILVALLIATTAACLDTSTDEGTEDFVVFVRAYDGDALLNAPGQSLEAGPVSGVEVAPKRPELRVVPGIQFPGNRPVEAARAIQWDKLSDPNGETTDSICGCATEACRQAWVVDNYGTGICVFVDCGEQGASGACVAPPAGAHDATAGVVSGSR